MSTLFFRWGDYTIPFMAPSDLHPFGGRRATIKDSVAQFGPHVRTSGCLLFLQASKARKGPLATSGRSLLLRPQPAFDARQIDGRGDLQVVQVHLVLSPVTRLAQSLAAHALGDGGFDPCTQGILFLKRGGDLLPAALLQGLLHRLTRQRQTASIRTARTRRAHRAGPAHGL